MNLKLIVLLVAVGLAGVLPVHAQNLLVNPSFEAAPYGNLPYDGVYAPAGWTPSSGSSLTSYTGVFDSTWKNHNCNYPTWPDPVHQPVDGSYFLAKWRAPYDGSQTACEFENNASTGSYGHLRQTITGLTPGATYYFSAWYANNNPHGWWTDRGWQYPMFRVGVLAQDYDAGAGTYTPEYDAIDPTDTLGVVFVPLQEENPEEWSNYLKKMAGSDEAWSKLSGKVTLGPNQDTLTYFVEFFVDKSIGYSEPQYVQVDNCRLAQTNLLAVSNVQITAINSTSVTIEWDVLDGDAMVTGLIDGPCYLEYGPTTAYGTTVPATEPNPTICNGDVAGKPGHYKVVLSDLTTGQTYNYRIVVDPGSYTRVEPFKCGDGSTIYSATWSYDGTQSVNATFTPNPQVSITSGPTATNITKDSATITWQTDVPADSKVEYGKLGVFEDVKTDAALTTSHSVTLTGLWPNTNTYIYKVTSSAPSRSPKTSSNFTFKTLLGTSIMNGDFEFRPVTAAKAPYWTDVPLNAGPILFHTPEWGVSAHDGQWFLSMVTNFGGAQEKKGVYQQVATTPGDIVSVYAWSYADGHADCAGAPAGDPHRFGEINNQLGLDPTGKVPSTFNSWLPSVVWGGQLSSLNWNNFANNICGKNGEWRRIGICAVAEASSATIYLRARSWYGNGWLYNVWDNVTLEAPTAVQSVGAMKALPMQTNVNLTQGDYVITYVQPFNVNADENGGQPYFYIQYRNKGGAGIKVTIAQRSNWPSWLDNGVGKKVNIIGTLDWGVFNNLRMGNLDQQLRRDKPAGEMVLRAVKITDTGLTASLPEPVGVTNFSLGGGSSADPYFTNAGVDGGSGANNVGMRVRTWGKIVEMGTDASGFIYMIIDDGSRLPAPPAAPITVTGVQVPGVPGTVTGTMVKTSKISDYQHQPGLYVQTWDPIWPVHDDWTDVAVGDYVILTGISGVRLDLDIDDHQCVVAGSTPESPDLIPEAEKNMRTIKLEAGGAKYFKLQ